MNENDLLLNQAFCLPIDSEFAVSNEAFHHSAEDVGKTYQELGLFVTQKNNQWYVIPERDAFGNWVHTIAWGRFEELRVLFNGSFKPFSEIPSEEA